ncbi:Hpt domain-containing protein [Vibrio sp. JC009]|uniref:Hpt domain-containing protein n=1 Tax=Vibrio sp. JC009 TaxID=2912314 RepID=UPI0023AE7860|nr:Hpt domain-containing protein [Vibrio sp. JC009]WED20896.1 Hpt domain-containing protein [Vibrio sp. JC009]
MTCYLNLGKIDDLCNEIGRDNLPVLLDIFLSELDGYHTVLSGDLEELQHPLREISHALKSSAASFGADNLCELAKSLDAKAKAGEQLNTDEYRESILESIRKTIREYNVLKEDQLTH